MQFFPYHSSQERLGRTHQHGELPWWWGREVCAEACGGACTVCPFLVNIPELQALASSLAGLVGRPVRTNVPPASPKGGLLEWGTLREL